MMKKKIMTTALTGMVLLSGALGTNSLTAHAGELYGGFGADEQWFLKTSIFDADYYAATYPDVVEALGTDNKEAMLKHYLEFGIYEGRDASATFNADAYASANPDLVTAYNSDDDKMDYFHYAFHYYTFGKNEGRLATVADVTAAGYNVTSVFDDTKVIAPATSSTVTYVYTPSSSSSSGSSSSGSSSSGSSNSGSSNSGSSNSGTNTSSSNTTSSNTSSSNPTSGTGFVDGFPVIFLPDGTAELATPPVKVGYDLMPSGDDHHETSKY